MLQAPFLLFHIYFIDVWATEGSFVPCKLLIHLLSCLMCVLQTAFGMDQEIPEYDMDSEDEQWLNRQVKHLKMDVSSLKFESMMDRLEKGSGQMVHIFTYKDAVY